MLTGRFTYGLGQTGDATEPVAVGNMYSPVAVDLTQSSIAQVAPAQWGMGEWAMVLGGMWVLYSVTSTTKRGVRRVQSYREQRKKRLVAKHEASADYYKS